MEGLVFNCVLEQTLEAKHKTTLPPQSGSSAPSAEGGFWRGRQAWMGERGSEALPPALSHQPHRLEKPRSSSYMALVMVSLGGDWLCMPRPWRSAPWEVQNPVLWCQDGAGKEASVCGAFLLVNAGPRHGTGRLGPHRAFILKPSYFQKAILEFSVVLCP